MPHIRILGLGHGVVVDVNDLVQVSGDDLGHLHELVVDKGLVALCDEHGQANGGQIAHGHPWKTATASLEARGFLREHAC